MTDLQITCDNCGAKYKLPPTFTGAQAKCQKCGSVIDVARQRAAAAGGAGSSAGTAAKPAAARPAAAAKPAVDRSKEANKPAAREATKPARETTRSTKATERPTRRGREEGKDEDEPKHGRERKKDSSMPILLAGVGLLALIGGGVFLLKGGDKPADAAQTAKKEPTPVAEAPKPEAPKPDTPKPDAPKPDAPKSDSTPAQPAGAPAQPAAGTTDKPKAPEGEATPPPTDPAPATPDDPSRPKRPWEKQKNPPQSMDQVVDPKSFGEVAWPADVDAKVKTDVQALVEDIANGGKAGIRAKPKLVELGYPALFGLVEKLRVLDYKSTEDSQLAFEMNKIIEDITVGANAGFEPVEATETLVPAKAEWNSKSVKSWLGFLAKYPDEASFKTFRKEQRAKQEK